MRWSAALLSTVLAAGCSAPPSKPPKPKPLVSHTKTQAGGQAGQAGGAPGSEQSGSGAGAPGSAQGYGAASANGAEVDEEEVAADGTTRVVSSTGHAAQGGSGNTDSGGQGGGGSVMPAGAAPGGATSGAGPHGVTQKTGQRYDDMVGIDLGQPPASDQRSGNPQGELDGRSQAAQQPLSTPPVEHDAARLGVRGGADQSGLVEGTPAIVSPSRQREQAPVRENDMLAQQLREAAEREKDPVLREKLWAEYRKYTSGL